MEENTFWQKVKKIQDTQQSHRKYGHISVKPTAFLVSLMLQQELDRLRAHDSFINTEEKGDEIKEKKEKILEKVRQEVAKDFGFSDVVSSDESDSDINGIAIGVDILTTAEYRFSDDPKIKEIIQEIEKIKKGSNPENDQKSQSDPWKKFNFFLDELLKTEEQYLRRLKELQTCEESLKTLVEDANCTVHDYDIDQIFCNVNKLLTLSKELYDDLKVAVEKFQEAPSELTNVFKKYGPQMYKYSIYCSNYQQRTLSNFERWMENDTFFCEKVKNLPFNVSSLLAQPFQRAMRYQMQLENLVNCVRKIVGKQDPKFFEINCAYSLMKSVATVINCNMNFLCPTVAEEKWGHFKEHLDMVPTVLMENTPLRQVFRGCNFSLTVGHNLCTKKNCSVFLFDNYFMVARPTTLVRRVFQGMRRGSLAVNDEMSKMKFLVCYSWAHVQFQTFGNSIHCVFKDDHIKLQFMGAKAHKTIQELETVCQLAKRDGQEVSRMRAIDVPGVQIMEKIQFMTVTLDDTAIMWTILVLIAITFSYVAGFIFPEERHTTLWKTIANKFFIKLFGYFLPFLALQLFRLHADAIDLPQSPSRSWRYTVSDIFDDFFGGWMCVWFVTRFISEPLVNIMFPWLTHGDGAAGIASHAVLTYATWGFTMLSCDTQWIKTAFQSLWVRRTPNFLSQTSFAVMCLIWLAFISFLYLHMAYVTTAHGYHNIWEWLASLLTGCIVLIIYYILNLHGIQQHLKLNNTAIIYQTVFTFFSIVTLIIAIGVIVIKQTINPDYRLHSQYWSWLASEESTVVSRLIGDIIIAVSGLFIGTIMLIIATRTKTKYSSFRVSFWMPSVVILIISVYYVVRPLLENFLPGCGDLNSYWSRLVLYNVSLCAIHIQAGQVGKHFRNIKISFKTAIQNHTCFFVLQLLLRASRVLHVVYLLFFFQLLARSYGMIIDAFIEKNMWEWFLVTIITIVITLLWSHLLQLITRWCYRSQKMKQS